MQAKKEPQYRELQEQLDQVLVKLQAEDVDVETALELYKQGQDLVKKLEKHLAQAENTIRELKQK